MRRALGTMTLATAATAAAVALYLALTVPPQALRFDGVLPDTFVSGAYHVHTSRSDGSAATDDVAAAAARAGLHFIVFTDHGDATRAPDLPVYRHGVLGLDAVEINTTTGHLVALGLSQPAPYPLAGHPRDVLEDVHRLGGVGVVAHPDSPRPSLRWRGQGQSSAFDGVEWLNIDSEWRDEPGWRLAATAARTLIRGPESVASLISRPTGSLQRLDAAARVRPAFGVLALDAHARIAWRDAEDAGGALAVPFPSYETLFRTAAQTLILSRPLSGDAEADAKLILDALTAGRSFSVIRAFAEPAALAFNARQGSRAADMGGRLDPADGPVTLTAAVPQAPGARVALTANGRQVAAGQGGVEYSATTPGAYRVEVTLTGRSAPWLLSNPIVLAPSPGQALPEPTEEVSGTVHESLPAEADRWSIEREPTSSAALTIDGGALRLDYALASGAPRGQYAALVASVGSQSGMDRVRFVGRASRPLRVSVQVRLPGGAEGRRWRRSVYLDETPRPIVIRLQEFEPVDDYTSQRPIVSPIQSLLFVVDTVNTRPGTDGTLWLSEVDLGLRTP